MISHARLLAGFFTLLFFCPVVDLNAQTSVSGVVRDENREPLAFATVYFKNSSNGTVANAKGEFRLLSPRGPQELIVQYIGYKQLSRKMEVGEKPLYLELDMEPSDLEIKEVVITGEDPGERIMREVIARRKYFKSKIGNHVCEAYIKGVHRLDDSPKKMFGREIGNMGGVLDSNGTGIIYLSESVSRLYVQNDPTRKKEVMLASKIAGAEDGFSLNRSTYTDFNLYDERIEIEREILSPTADNAFSYYRFKYLGEFYNAYGFKINKIRVTPKRNTDPAFSGYLYIVDEIWNIAEADLSLTGDAIKQPVLDTLRIQQAYIPLELPDTWALLSQITSFKFGIFGFKVNGFFNGVFSNYELNPTFPKDLFGAEEFKIEDLAGEKDYTYWKETRPVPLTTEESRDYVKKDSLQKIWKSEAYLDSIDRKNNRFKPMDLLFGYSWNDSYRHREISVPSVLRTLEFNTVQGFAVTLKPQWRQDTDRRGNSFWALTGSLNYGFSEKKPRGGLRFQRRFESKYYQTVSVEVGTAAVQVNGAQPITPFLNTLYSLFLRENYLRLYEKSFALVEWSRVLRPGLYLRAQVEYADRKPLENTTNYSFKAESEERRFLPNLPSLNAPHQAFIADIYLRIRPKETYSSYPKFRVYESSKWPEFQLRIRQGIPGVGGSDTRFTHLSAAVLRENLSWGIGGYTDLRTGGGIFIYPENRAPDRPDIYHPLGNQTLFGTNDHWKRGFSLLPYYAYGTNSPYVTAFARHHFQGWLTDKIPGFRKLNLKEVFGAAFYYTRSEAASNTRLDPYFEVYFGFENIGFKAIRPLTVQYVWGFFGDQKFGSGLQIGVDL